MVGLNGFSFGRITVSLSHTFRACDKTFFVRRCILNVHCMLCLIETEESLIAPIRYIANNIGHIA